MLSKIIVNSYKAFIEISLWLSLLVFVISGWSTGSSPFGGGGGFMGAVIGAILWFVFAVVFFGAFLVLEDIRDRLKNIESSKK